MESYLPNRKHPIFKSTSSVNNEIIAVIQYSKYTRCAHGHHFSPKRVNIAEKKIPVKLLKQKDDQHIPCKTMKGNLLG